MSSQGTVLVRDAKAKDALGIARVHVASWQGAYRGQVPDRVLDSLSVAARETMWRRELERPAVDGHLVWVAESSEAIVGFADAGPARDEDMGGVGELYAIYVEPAHWGRGVGRALIEAVLAGLSGAGYEESALWVLESNERARSFYERGGWTWDGSRKAEDRGGWELRQVRYRCRLRPRDLYSDQRAGAR